MSSDLVLVQPVKLRSIAREIKSSAEKIENSLMQVDTTIQSLGPVRFEGNQATHLRGRYDQQRSRISYAPQLVRKFGDHLEIIADRFHAADTKLGESKVKTGGRYSKELVYNKQYTTPENSNARIAEMIETLTTEEEPVALVPMGVDENGDPVYVVLIRGTEDGNYENNWFNNPEAYAGRETGYERSIETLIETHIKPPATIHLAGHSQGGLMAINLVDNLSEYNVGSVTTYGAPVNPEFITSLPEGVDTHFYAASLDPIINGTEFIDTVTDSTIGQQVNNFIETELQYDRIQGNLNPLKAHDLSSYYNDLEVRRETPPFTLPDQPTGDVIHLDRGEAVSGLADWRGKVEGII
jgi:hypothetical protein